MGKQCKKCQTQQSHRWFQGPLCVSCYNSKEEKYCISCDKTKKSTRWYSGPTCGSCYTRNYNLKNQKVCIKCNSKKSKTWYGGPTCRSCWHKDYMVRKKKGLVNLVGVDTYELQSIRGRFTAAKGRLKQRKKKLSWDIKFNDYVDIIKKTCFYCSKDLLLEFGTGLDRIDNSLGYTVNNVLPCCGNCNKIRGDYLTVDEMVHVMSSLMEYRKINKHEQET